MLRGTRTTVMFIPCDLKRLVFHAEFFHDLANILGRQAPVDVKAVDSAAWEKDYPPTGIVIVGVGLESSLTRVVGNQFLPELVMPAVLDGLAVGLSGLDRHGVGQNRAVNFKEDSDHCVAQRSRPVNVVR